MYEKLENGDDLFDHELLEILLYSVCPRINTNPLAHALLDRFMSLPNVFDASTEELKQVNGVGDSVARFIKTVGMCFDRAERKCNSPTLRTLSDCKRFADLRLSGKSEERVEMYFVNKACRVQHIVGYTTDEKSRAAANIESVAMNIAVFKPFGIIIAHNHIKGTESPSEYDDGFTRVVQFICNIYGVQLLDHIVYLSRDKIFSYNDSGRLKKEKNVCNWETFEKWIKTLN